MRRKCWRLSGSIDVRVCWLEMGGRGVYNVPLKNSRASMNQSIFSSDPCDARRGRGMPHSKLTLSLGCSSSGGSGRRTCQMMMPVELFSFQATTASAPLAACSRAVGRACGGQQQRGQGL